MILNTNLSALNVSRNLKNVTYEQGRAAHRLSSGFRINSAADDAAGLAISEKMRSQIRGLDQASRNIQDGISVIQTTEGALAEVSEIIKRIRELCVQGANDTNVSEDRKEIAQEVWQLSREIRETEDRVVFNGIKVLDTAKNKNPKSINGMQFQVGANSNQTMKVDLCLSSLDIPSGYVSKFGKELSLLYVTSSMLNHVALSLEGAKGDNHVAGSSYNYSGDDDDTGLSYTMNLGITGKSQTEWITFMIGNVDQAAENISTVRANLGAYQNRLEHSMLNADVTSENLSASESRIRDADMAREMMRNSVLNVLQQASISMLAQANQKPQNVLNLLS